MRKYLYLAAFPLIAAISSAALAEDSSYYSCQNDPVPILLPSLPVDEALAVFTQATRCPVSKDFKYRARGNRVVMRTRYVKGEMSPDEALRRMLAGLPLKSRSIHGGYSIY